MFTDYDRQRYEYCKRWVSGNYGTPEQLARYRAYIAEYDAQSATVDTPAQTNLFEQTNQADPEPVNVDQVDQAGLADDIPGDSRIRIHSLLALSAGRGNHPGALQVWYLARSIDPDGSGVVKRADMQSLLRSLRVSERSRRRWMSDAKSAGLLRSARSGTVYLLTSLVRAAELFGCADIGGTALVSARDWAGKHWRSFAWGAFLEGFGRMEKITDQSGAVSFVRVYSPVSRVVLAQISGVPEQTQRDLERYIPVIRRKNYKITDTPADYIDEYKRLEGVKHAIKRQVKGEGEKVAVRLPDRRRVKAGLIEHLGFGRAKSIRKNGNLETSRGHTCDNTASLGDASPVDGGHRPDGSATVGAAGGRVGRLFFWDDKALDRTARKMGARDVRHIRELFRKIPAGGRHYRCGWWAVVPLLTPAGCESRA